MNSIPGSLFKNRSESQLVQSGDGTLMGIIINSHTSGTLKILDALEDGAQAVGTLTSDATNVSDGDTVTVDTTVYRFKNTLAQAYDVKIGANAAGSLANLKKAINATGTAGTDYYTGTLAHSTCYATTLTSTTLIITCQNTGTAGNSIATTETSSHLSFGGATLASGTGPTGRILMNTYTLPSGSSTIQIPQGVSFKTGLYISIASTVVDYTPLYL